MNAIMFVDGYHISNRLHCQIPNHGVQTH